MTGISAICINDNFAACQTGITLRSTNNKPARRIDEIFGLRIQQFFRYYRQNDMLLDIGLNLFQGNFLRMLRRDDDRIHANRLIILVFNRNLRLTVRSQIIQCTILPHLGQTAGNAVRQSNRKRH
ncbi:hypothetical protein D3C71_1332870 [compost metagenome]